MVKDWLTTYKFGWKTSYYQNTYDMSTDSVEEEKSTPEDILSQLDNMEEDDCESCKIWPRPL